MTSVSHELLESGSKLKLLIRGDLISTTVENLKREIGIILESQAVADADWSTLCLDLTASHMVDSLGLNLILTLVKKAQVRSAKVCVTISSQPIYRTFLATRMDKLMQLEILESKATG